MSSRLRLRLRHLPALRSSHIFPSLFIFIASPAFGAYLANARWFDDFLARQAGWAAAVRAVFRGGRTGGDGTGRRKRLRVGG
ncbi:hypothetical protein EDC01DRAFT_781655 [Geopyxis carbonaria]|nr:hypothetical protein EDC01DRAFT_781655 [Geopyxis carbonaria]